VPPPPLALAPDREPSTGPLLLLPVLPMLLLLLLLIAPSTGLVWCVADAPATADDVPETLAPIGAPRAEEAPKRGTKTLAPADSSRAPSTITGASTSKGTPAPAPVSPAMPPRLEEEDEEEVGSLPKPPNGLYPPPPTPAPAPAAAQSRDAEPEAPDPPTLPPAPAPAPTRPGAPPDKAAEAETEVEEAEEEEEEE
jgi:hypothetical protein